MPFPRGDKQQKEIDDFLKIFANHLANFNKLDTKY